MPDVAHLNVEIKAACADPERALERLLAAGARLQGVDVQTDVYYAVPRGRLKLRRGAIENNLIHYHRPDGPAPKQSQVRVMPLDTSVGFASGEELGELLDAALDRDIVVEKRRHILWLGNVKFHIDEVAGLGSFLEVEAINRDGSRRAEHLLDQCRHYMQLLDVRDEDLQAESYSDMLRERRDSNSRSGIP